MSHARHSAEQRPGPETPPQQRRWLALAMLALAQFMLILDLTVVNVALPTIRTELGLDREALTWVVAAYALAFGGFMLLGGRLADVFGPRRTLLTGLAVFTAASLAADIAGGGPLLIGGRIAQGLGAALLSPAALATLAATFQGRDRDRAFGVWAAIGGAGSALGVLVGGLLTAGAGWRWVFFVNVPVGVLVLIGLPMLLKATRAAGTRDRKVDVPGAVAGAFVMLVASPLMLAYFFLSSLYLQGVLGFSALRTGLVFLPVAISVGLGAQGGRRWTGHVVQPLSVPRTTAGRLAKSTRLTSSEHATRDPPWFQSTLISSAAARTPADRPLFAGAVVRARATKP